jgi:hypothetical protein
MPTEDATSTALRQGDVRLLDHPVAAALLASRELARLSYVAADGTARVFPMLFHWTGTELVFGTFAGARKIAALRARPEVAVTIDASGPPLEVLLLRGTATVDDVEGIVPEYAAAHHRYYGPEQGAAAVAEVDRPGTRMARIAVTPTWIGVLEFQTRFPARSGWRRAGRCRDDGSQADRSRAEAHLGADPGRRRLGLALAPGRPRTAGRRRGRDLGGSARR